jgi:hypothetical protein
MNELVAQPQLNSELEAMAAELARRRKRLFTLNILILIVPLVAAIIFFLFGKDDRTWVRDKVVETVGEIVPPKIEQTVPPRVREALVESRVEERLAMLEAKLGPPASDEEPGVEDGEERTEAGVPTGTSVPQELLNQLNNLAALRSRLEEVEASLQDLEQPDGAQKVPALWASLGTQESQLEGQEAFLEDHLSRILALEELKEQLAQQKVIERLGKAEEEMREIAIDLNTKVGSISDLKPRLIRLENELGKFGDIKVRFNVGSSPEKRAG